jgi:hypothetical protein
LGLTTKQGFPEGFLRIFFGILEQGYSIITNRQGKIRAWKVCRPLVERSIYGLGGHG